MYNIPSDELNLAMKTNFVLLVHRIPNTLFFVQKSNLPGVTLGEASHPTPLLDRKIPGDKLTYSELTASFVVDDKYTAYSALFKWIEGLGFPANHQQFIDLKENWLDAMKYPLIKEELREKIGRYASLSYDQSSFQFSEATLHVLDSQFNEVIEARFIDLFPTSLSSLDYDATASSNDPIICDVNFSFSEMKLQFKY